MSDLGDTTPEGHRFKRGVGNSSSTAVSSFLSLRRLGLFWYFSSGGEGKRLAPVRLRAHRAAAPSFSFKKPRGSPPALRGAGREAPAWGVTYRSAATGAPRAPRPNRAGAAARLLRCPPRLRLHLPPLSQDLPEAWTVAPGGGGGSEGGGGGRRERSRLCAASSDEPPSAPSVPGLPCDGPAAAQALPRRHCFSLCLLVSNGNCTTESQYVWNLAWGCFGYIEVFASALPDLNGDFTEDWAKKEKRGGGR